MQVERRQRVTGSPLWAWHSLYPPSVLEGVRKHGLKGETAGSHIQSSRQTGCVLCPVSDWRMSATVLSYTDTHTHTQEGPVTYTNCRKVTDKAVRPTLSEGIWTELSNGKERVMH